MADKTSQLIVLALSRAAAESTGCPLHGSRAQPGLFPSTAAGKQAAARCLQDGLLRARLTPPSADPFAANGSASTAVQSRTRAAAERYVVTDKGLRHLFEQTSPRQVLEDMVRVLEARQEQLDDLAGKAQGMLDYLGALQAQVQRLLDESRPAAAGPGYVWSNEDAGDPEADHAAALRGHLRAWRSADNAEDCPLPELYRRARAGAPSLSIGRFHDALRELFRAGEVYLHPWTGPLYAVPEPAFVLLCGHEPAYYVSPRD